MSDKAITELTEATKSLALENYDLPESWADDEEDPGSNIKRFLADWPQYQERFEAQGMPSYRVIKDTFGNTRLSLVPGPGTMLLAKVFWPKTRLNSSP